MATDKNVNVEIESLQESQKMRYRKYKLLLFTTVATLTLYYLLGVGDYLSAQDFEESFVYPLNTDVKALVKDVLAGKNVKDKAINYYPYRFLTNSRKCSTVDKLDLFIVVKSAMNKFEYRQAIRQSYGQEYSVPGRTIKVLFFLGVGSSSEIQRKVQDEMADHKDIIQMDFIDAYFNNTIKTMMAFRWLYQHCSQAEYYLFTDDDMYISVPNLLEYTESTKKTNSSHLFAGYVFKSGPHRVHTSKWRVSLEEWPWNQWPPYVTAGAYVLSKKSMIHLYIGSLYTQHFRFDDIYLGIVAKKVGIVPRHCDQFHFYKKAYDKEGYKDVIAAHGFDNHVVLVTAWNEQMVLHAYKDEH